jgi:hypothetical protein
VTDPTRSDAAGGPTEGTPPDAGPRERPSSPRWILVAGLVLLVVGIAVCVLGRLAASSASDDLATANRKLHDQQLATAAARRCASSLQSAVAPLLNTAQALVGTAGTIADQDSQIVAAARDGQAAGAQARIDDYNRSVDRGNAAAAAANAAIDTGKAQSTTLEQQASALPACSSGARASAVRDATRAPRPPTARPGSRRR